MLNVECEMLLCVCLAMNKSKLLPQVSALGVPLIMPVGHWHFGCKAGLEPGQCITRLLTHSLSSSLSLSRPYSPPN